MDSPVENIIDLGLTNFVRHPSDPNYVVFRFADSQRAMDFEDLLKEEKIEYEKGEEQKQARTYYLFGVKNKDFEAAQKINFKVEAKNKKFIIQNGIIRWILLVFSFGITLLAIIGYCSRPV